MAVRDELKNVRRIVVKVGTSTLAYGPGRLNIMRMEKLVRELADLSNQGKEMILVSSGAIAAGLGRLGLAEKPSAIPAKQAAAAVGQGVLMHIYEKMFSEYGKTMGQMLLTKENAVRHHQYINSRQALLALLNMGIIPVINENDAVAVDEIKIGDNDNLSAMVATLVDADVLIILSDINGLYECDPQINPNARLIDTVSEITPEIERLAGGAGTKLGTGGMATKIAAAQIAINAGVTMLIVPGAADNILHRVLSGEIVGTIFPAKAAHLKVRKSWLAFGKRLEGDIVVDEGAAQAMLTQGSSLLAAGITDVDGEFSAQSTVRILAPTGREIARGIVNYDYLTVKNIAGQQTKDFAPTISGKVYEEVIHRDNMVLMA